VKKLNIINVEIASPKRLNINEKGHTEGTRKRL